MAASTSLYTGFVRGRSNPINLGPNNPAIDTSLREKDAQAKLAAHINKGTKTLPKVDGPRQRVRNSGVSGTRQPGMRTRGGTL